MESFCRRFVKGESRNPIPGGLSVLVIGGSWSVSQSDVRVPLAEELSGILNIVEGEGVDSFETRQYFEGDLLVEQSWVI